MTNALQARLEIVRRESHAEAVRSYNLAIMLSAAFAGKLKSLDHYLPPSSAEAEAQSQGNAAILGALLKMKRKGVPMTIERIERAA